MALPPSIKVLAPSLSIDPVSNVASLSSADLERMAALAVAHVVVDEDWYIARYADVRETVQARGSKSYAVEHYRTRGFLEGRLPYEPVVDEEWYRKTYPDIDEAIRRGRHVDGKSHFIENGYQEGRKSAPDMSATSEGPAPVAPGGRGHAPRSGVRVPLSRVALRAAISQVQQPKSA
jgi:hypothetical protein